jgi:phage terminase large subunit
MTDLQEEVSIVDKASGKVTVLYKPTAKGVEFHRNRAPYCLTHGGRNSGKSTILRWDAHLRNLLIPNHRALLLRRTFPQLRSTHFDRAAAEGKLLGCPKDFNTSKYFLEYPNGSKLQFGHCESDAAILDYLSQEWDWIGFDELTTFTFDQFIRIAASARTTIHSGRKAYVRAATNPIGEGASWVKRYFVEKNVDEVEHPGYVKADWADIAANMDDNPHADQMEYEKRLLMLPNESLRRAYRHGEWLVEGQFFDEFASGKLGKPWHVVVEEPRILHQDRMVPVSRVPWLNVTRVLDWGYSELEPGYCLWVLHMPDGTALAFKEWIFTRQIPEVAAEKIKDMSIGMKVVKTIGDPMMFAEREGKSIAWHFAQKGVSMIPADNDRENGWVALHSWLVSTYNDGLAERPRLQFLAPQALGTGVAYAIRTLPSLQVDPKRPRDITQATGVEDHAADALRYWASNWPVATHRPRPAMRMPKELRRAIYGQTEGSSEPLGSESVG